MRDKLIKWLGGYTKSEVCKVGRREFDDYDDMRRLGGFLPAGSEAEVLGVGISGKFAIRQYSDAVDNGGTIIKAAVSNE